MDYQRISIKVKNKLCASGNTVNYTTYSSKTYTLTRLSKQQSYSKLFNENLTATWLAQLVERQSAVREVEGSSPRPDQHSGS